MFFAALIYYYFYFLFTLFTIGLALILCGIDWAICADFYLKVVAWLQDRILEFYGLPNNNKVINSTFSPSDTDNNGQDNSYNEADEDKLDDVFEDPQMATNGSEIESSSSTAVSDSSSPATTNGSAFEFVQYSPSAVSTNNGLESVSSAATNSEKNDIDEQTEQQQKQLQEAKEDKHEQVALTLGLKLCGQGLQCIAREDLRINFTLAPDYRHYELAPLQKSLKLKLKLKFKLRCRRRSSSTTVTNKQNNTTASSTGKRRRQPEVRPRLLLFTTLLFRMAALLPVRLALLACSFFFLAISCVVNVFWLLSPLIKTRIGVIYCRMYTMGCGFIIRFHGKENRPKRPGVICANHLSPNDVHVIFADIPLERDYLYLITGQKHRGVIGILEHLVDKMCPALWLERADPESRRRFSIEMVDAAKNSGPVILFPEGYCTNNSQVLQFRRAVFQEDITVYPVAIKQESRFGDSYWSENHFFMYLLRVLTSWAIVYNVHYLAPQRRRSDESATDFAARVQRLIATRLGVRAVPCDGGLWYKEMERRKAHSQWQQRCANELQEEMV